MGNTTIRQRLQKKRKARVKKQVQNNQTFDEDRDLLEIQDRCLQTEKLAKIPQIAVKVDKAPLQGRRLLEAMIQSEVDNPNYCAVPIPIANDDVVTQPITQAAE